MKISLIAAVPLLLAVPAAGQGGTRSDTRGPFVGLHLNGTVLSPEEQEQQENEPNSGWGWGAQAGYGFTAGIAVLGRRDVADLTYRDGTGESYQLTHTEIGVRYSFLSGRSAVRPFLDFTLGRVASSQEIEEGTLRLTGGSFGIAAGVQAFPLRSIGVELGVAGARGEFTDGTIGGVPFELGDLQREFTTSRINLGVNWHP